MSEEIVVVVSGGEPPDPRAALAVPLGAPVVAADKGLEHALALGLEVTVAVGDFDSASPEAVAVAEAAGTRVERHPPEKDATDLELALDVALAMGPQRILVLAGRRRPARPPARRAAAPRLGALRGLAGRCARRRGTRPRHPRRALARRRAGRARLAARRCTARRRASRPKGSRTRSAERRSSRDRAAASRTSSPPRRRASRSSAACCSPIRPGRGRVTPCSVRSARSRRARCSPAAVRRRRDADRGRARHARLVRDLGRREAGVRGRERPHAADPQGGRRGRDRHARAPDRGRTRRATCCSASTTTCSRARSTGDVFEPYESPALDERRSGARARSRAPRDADRPRRRVPQLRQGVVRRARRSRRRATLDDLTLPRYRGPARRREPGDLDARARVPARDGRAVRRRRLAGLLARAARERRPRRRRLGGGVLRALLRRRRQQGRRGRSSSPTRRARRPR